MTATHQEEVARRPSTSGRWKRRLRWTGLVLAVVCALLVYAIKDHVRTLRSLRRVPGTNAYVMDYYVDYNIDEIRANGIDISHIEDSFLAVFFSDAMLPLVTRWKSEFVPIEIKPLDAHAHRCSTVVARGAGDEIFFGRNFDWKHDACLILKIHQEDGVSSIAVIDLAYLKMDRADLDQTNLIDRVPLLFAPYYVMDGMNRHGVAVSDMAVKGAEAPYDAAKPDVLLSTAMRVILDHAKTTDEAIQILREYNIHFVETNCHLMIADAQGASAVVEFIDGELKSTCADEPWQVCTNHRIVGKSEEENDHQCRRYRLASDQLAALNRPADGDDVMAVMKSVSVENWTMWTTVYNLTTGEFRIAYRRHFEDEHREQLGTGN